jgi:pre-mRNA-processing factor 40
MNGFPPQPAATWQEARAADGRVYYYNTITKATQWSKPEEMLNPSEVRVYTYLCPVSPLTDICIKRALAQSPWKEYTHSGGRKYWHNSETNITTWEMPDVLKNAQNQAQPKPQAPAPVKPAAP